MFYCTQQNLITRYSVDEIVQLAAPKTLRYLGEAASAAALAATFATAVADDLAYASAEAEFYRYSGTAWAVNPLAKIATAIADAQAEIDSYLTGYLPLSPVPANFERIACDITRYHLNDDLATEQIKERYKSHVIYLTKVAEGKISIAPDTAGTIDATTDAGVDYQTVAAGFGDLSGF